MGCTYIHKHMVGSAEIDFESKNKRVMNAALNLLQNGGRPIRIYGTGAIPGNFNVFIEIDFNGQIYNGKFHNPSQEIQETLKFYFNK